MGKRQRLLRLFISSEELQKFVSINADNIKFYTLILSEEKKYFLVDNDLVIAHSYTLVPSALKEITEKEVFDLSRFNPLTE